MPFESLRKKLISQQVDWGASPPTHGHISSATALPKSGTIPPQSPLEPLPDATTTTAMEYVAVERSRSKCSVSSKDWTIDGLIKRGPRFQKVPRVSALMSSKQLLAAIEHHECSGTPLIIEGWHKHPKWPKKQFTVDWLREHGRQGTHAVYLGDATSRHAVAC